MLTPSGASAHKFYASLAQIERVPEGRLEVGIRLFPDDVEQALTAAEGRRVVIDNTASFQRALLKYLDSTLVVEAGGERAKWRYVGVDPMVNLLWVFVEADWPKPLKGASVTNKLLLEISGEQVNTVNLTDGNAKESISFTAARTSAEAFAAKK
jgi:hypothetical protein